MRQSERLHQRGRDELRIGELGKGNEPNRLFEGRRKPPAAFDGELLSTATLDTC